MLFKYESTNTDGKCILILPSSNNCVNNFNIIECHKNDYKREKEMDNRKELAQYMHHQVKDNQAMVYSRQEYISWEPTMFADHLYALKNNKECWQKADSFREKVSNCSI